MTHSSHTASRPQTAQHTGEAAGTDERQLSRDHHQDDHYKQKPHGSIALTCDDAGTRSILSEIAGVLHFLSDADDPAGVVEILADALAPGSFVTISHLTSDFAPDQVGAGVAAYNALVPVGLTARTHREVTSLFGRLALIPPGVVPVSEWRPEHAPVRGVSADMYVGLATTRRSR